MLSPLKLSENGPTIPGGPRSWTRWRSVLVHDSMLKTAGGVHELPSPWGTPPA